MVLGTIDYSRRNTNEGFKFAGDNQTPNALQTAVMIAGYDGSKTRWLRTNSSGVLKAEISGVTFTGDFEVNAFMLSDGTTETDAMVYVANEDLSTKSPLWQGIGGYDAVNDRFRALRLDAEGILPIGKSVTFGDGIASNGTLLSTPTGTNNSAPVVVMPLRFNGTTWDRDGGSLPFFDSDVDNTAQELKATGGNLFKLNIINPNTDDMYLQLFNTAAASVTVGTTPPVYVILVPGEGSIIDDIPQGMSFTTAITYAATTTATGGVDPTTGLILSALYK